MDGSPLTFAMWNNNTFSEAVPFELETTSLALKNPESVNYSTFTNILKDAQGTVYPQANNKNNCSLAYITFARKMAWIQIPCNKQILGDWVCKRTLKNKHFVWNPFLCEDEWYQINEKCIYIQTFKEIQIDRFLHYAILNDIPSINVSSIKEDSYGESLINMISSFMQMGIKMYFTISVGHNCLLCNGTIWLLFRSDHLCNIHNETIAEPISVCPYGQFQCYDGSCISILHLCDGQSDCRHSEDENHSECFCLVKGISENNSSFCRHMCHPINCTCKSLCLQNDDGGCIPYYKTPQLTAHGYLQNDTYPCSNGNLILKLYVNDIVPDCEDAGDEF